MLCSARMEAVRWDCGVSERGLAWLLGRKESMSGLRRET
jgi:hypothetical protein